MGARIAAAGSEPADDASRSGTTTAPRTQARADALIQSLGAGEARRVLNSVRLPSETVLVTFTERPGALLLQVTMPRERLVVVDHAR
jgi:hypothetical protein